MNRSRVGAGMAALVLALAACAAPGETANDPPATAAPSAATSPAARPTTATPTVTASSQPAATLASPGPAGAVVEDPSLLGVLPAAVAGVPVAIEHQSFLDAAADPDFASNVDAAAFVVAVYGNDLASGVVARLAPGRYSDAFFRDWRDTYDEGACGQSGGLTRNAQASLGGRTVYIGSCAGGLRTYHAWLPERGVIVSLFSVGDRRFGEELMAGLRP